MLSRLLSCKPGLQVAEEGVRGLVACLREVTMLGRALHAGLQGRCAAVLKKAQHTPRFPREAGCRLLSSADLETREYIEQWQHAQVRDQEWCVRTCVRAAL